MIILLGFIALVFFGYSIFYFDLVQKVKGQESHFHKQFALPNAPYGKSEENHEYVPLVSIIVCFRNERFGLPKLVESLNQLDYPKEKLQFIFVNDHSIDDSILFLEKSLRKFQFDNFKIIHLEEVQKGISHKKIGIDRAIEFATGDFIALTDGDCMPTIEWISSAVRIFKKQPQTQMICGFIDYESIGPTVSWLEKIIDIELLGLMCTTAGTIYNQKPTMCNGGNLIFKKQAYFKINGYKGFWDQPSGDDEFLMHKIMKAFGNKSIYFNPNIKAKVYTQSVSNLRAFYEQRKRWSSKWGAYHNSSIQLLAFFIFLVHFLELLILLHLIFNIGQTPLFLFELIIFGVKMLTDAYIIKQMAKIYKRRFDMEGFILNSLFYPFYVVFFGIISRFGSYHWKGRKY